MTYRHAKRDLFSIAVAVAVSLATTGCDDSAKHTTAQTRVPATRPAPQTSSTTVAAAIPTGNPPFLLPKLPFATPSHTQIAYFRILQKPSTTPINNESLIARVEEKFASGQQNYKAGHLEAARKDFDEALDLMLESGRDLNSDPKLSELFHRVVDTTYTYELQAFQAGDGFQEAPAVPAPIDEVAEMTFPVDPRLKDRAELAAKNISHDLPLTVNDEVLSFLNFFQTPRGRAIVEAGLRRQGRYKDMISRVLKEEGVPQDLIYLAQAESAFQPLALSRADR